MDKTGLGALVAGLVLSAAGLYGIWAFLPHVIDAVKGLVGIVILLIGLFMVLFGILIIKD